MPVKDYNQYGIPVEVSEPQKLTVQELEVTIARAISEIDRLKEENSALRSENSTLLAELESSRMFA